MIFCGSESPVRNEENEITVRIGGHEIKESNSENLLGIIVDRVDLDKNKVISMEELKKWIEQQQVYINYPRNAFPYNN